jgi:hypothetical protein
VRRLGTLVTLTTLVLACAADVPVAQAPAPSPAPATGPQAATAALKFDGGRAWAHLERQVKFGPRPAGSEALAQTRQYLIAELKAAGIEARQQTFEPTTPAGPIRMVNVIATIPGRRPERIALASHYDTKRYQQFRFVGASDGASSTAVVLELARLLNSRQNEYTVEVIFFDGEEAVRPDWAGTDNTYGSRHYVQTAQKDGTLASLKALVLLDMIGDRNLNIRRETTSTVWLTDIIWASARRLGYVREFLNEPFTVGGDDHFPFLEAGIPAIDIIDFDYCCWHQPTDDLPSVSQRSLQVVGDVVLDAWPRIEQRITAGR